MNIGFLQIAKGRYAIKNYYISNDEELKVQIKAIAPV